MIVIALLVPVILFLMLFALAALEDRMFPSPQPPGQNVRSENSPGEDTQITESPSRP